MANTPELHAGARTRAHTRTHQHTHLKSIDTPPMPPMRARQHGARTLTQPASPHMLLGSIQLCGDEFDTQGEFQAHMQGEHGQQPPAPPRPSADKPNAVAGGGAGGDDDDPMCEECGDEFDTIAELAQHMAAEHGLVVPGAGQVCAGARAQPGQPHAAVRCAPACIGTRTWAWAWAWM